MSKIGRDYFRLGAESYWSLGSVGKKEENSVSTFGRFRLYRLNEIFLKKLSQGHSGSKKGRIWQIPTEVVIFCLIDIFKFYNFFNDRCIRGDRWSCAWICIRQGITLKISNLKSSAPSRWFSNRIKSNKIGKKKFAMIHYQ